MKCILLFLTLTIIGTSYSEEGNNDKRQRKRSLLFGSISFHDHLEPVPTIRLDTYDHHHHDYHHDYHHDFIFKRDTSAVETDALEEKNRSKRDPHHHHHHHHYPHHEHHVLYKRDTSAVQNPKEDGIIRKKRDPHHHYHHHHHDYHVIIH
ncbi:hypothetical protein HHI36_008340 [Cryptolaemus montrouzieri]|uniref:Histidine-rich glycoprotein n=1 Tax=Cryptolaemus montrouzieri TaxID=559131 RepID=A0ABD2MSB1_9CUCU